MSLATEANEITVRLWVIRSSFTAGHNSLVSDQVPRLGLTVVFLRQTYLSRLI